MRDMLFQSTVVAIACVASIGFAQDKSDSEERVDKVDIQPVVTFTGHTTEVTSLAFWPMGRQIVSASLKGTRIWDSATGKEVETWKGDRGNVVAFSPDGHRIAIPGFKQANVHDAKNMKVLWSIDVPIQQQFEHRVRRSGHGVLLRPRQRSNRAAQDVVHRLGDKPKWTLLSASIDLEIMRVVGLPASYQSGQHCLLGTEQRPFQFDIRDGATIL